MKHLPVWKKYLVNFFGLSGALIILGFVYQQITGSLWDGKNQFAFVIQEKDIRVTVILPDQKKTVVFLLPENIFIKLDFGLGEYRLNKAYELGRLEKKGGKVLTRGVQNLLGIGVTGWQVDAKTNLSQWDKFRLKLFQMNAGKAEVIDLVNSQVLTKDNLEDGTEIFRAKTNSLDQLVHQEIFDEKIAEEAVSVAVFNASGVDGAANDLTRLITNSGAEVVLVGNQELVNQSYLGLSQDNLRQTKTVKALTKLLGISQIRKIEANKYRSDIVIIIGKDYTSL